MLGKIKTDEELFDKSAGYDDDIGVQLSPGLSPDDARKATVLYNLFNELWGVCIVVGDPGTGKDTFGNYLSYTLKRYFPYKRILRDEKPRPLFGEYAGLFNEQVIHDDLKKMRDLAKGIGATKIDDAMEKVADDWVTNEGEVLLHNSVLYLTEFWRYCYNREPHNPMNKTMGGIHKMKRHLDCLIIGTVQLPSELDKKTCLPWVDWRVTCTRSRVNKTGFSYFVEKVKYDRRLDMLTPVGKPLHIPVDAGKPRSFMGDGRITIRKPMYKPQSEEERVVLDALKTGVDNYEDLVDLLETEGDMSEWETLTTLKELRFDKVNSKLKWVVDYPCYWTIYNSKSAPQMKTTVKVSD